MYHMQDKWSKIVELRSEHTTIIGRNKYLYFMRLLNSDKLRLYYTTWDANISSNDSKQSSVLPSTIQDSISTSLEKLSK